MSTREQIEDLLRTERFEDCLAALGAPCDDEDAALGLLRARVHAKLDGIDRALLDLTRILALETLSPGECVEAWALSVELYGRKRCASLAQRQLARARAAVGNRPRLRLAEARMLLALDRRDEARALLEPMPDAEIASAQRMALANLYYIQGAFERAEALLSEPQPSAEEEASRLRTRANLHAVRGDHAAEAADWAALAQLLPRADARPSWMLNRAFALAAADSLDDAHAELIALWRAYPEHGVGKYARRCATRLEQRTGDARRLQLPMPTTHQKRDFCGPAVLELCLRALGIELDQDDIAKQVKREHGTPMYEIVRFLESHQVAARRIVANDRSLRAALNLGLPVILQEEYSTSSHVAVVCGYDDRLGVLLMQDPMTHRLHTRPFGWAEHAGALFGGGAVLVIGRQDAALPALLARVEEAGLVEAPHLRLIDDAARLRKGARGNEEASAEEVLLLTDRVLAQQPDFRLAWFYRLRARASIARRHSDEQGAFVRDLYHARARFPNDEWPFQLQGSFLLDHRRPEEAALAYRNAHLADVEDGNNLAWLGECHRRAGHLVRAEQLLLDGLAHHADEGFPETALSALYARHLALSDAPDEGVPPLCIELPAEVSEPLAYSPELALQRATYFAELACEHDPNNAFALELAGSIAMHRGDWTGAEQLFARALALDSERMYANLGAARCAEYRQRYADAEAQLQRAVEHAKGTPVVYQALATFYARTVPDDSAPRVAALERGLAECEGAREQFVEPLLEALLEGSSAEVACARLRACCEGHGDELGLLLSASQEMQSHGQKGHAIALLRRAHDLDPSSVVTLGVLGRLLCEDLLSREEGRTLLERAIELAPEWPYPRLGLASTCLDQPRRGLEVLQPVLGQDDPFAHEIASLLARASGDKAAAAKSGRRAIAALGGDELQARVRLAQWHTANNRYDEAVRHAQRLIELVEDGDTSADDAIVSAFRMAGRMPEILDFVRARCVDGTPPAELAFDVFFGTEELDFALSADAARIVAEENEREENEDEALEWRIREATQRARLGDVRPLQALESAMGTNAHGWSHLAWAQVTLRQYAAADRCAEQAYACDATSADTLTVMLEKHVRAGDYDHALDCARRIFELYPYEHRGPERLAELHALRLEVEPALAYSAHAADAAPFCHVALESRAMALLVAGELAEAERYAQRSLAIKGTPSSDEPDGARKVLYAARGDRAALERSLAIEAERLGVLKPAPYIALLRELASRDAS